MIIIARIVGMVFSVLYFLLLGRVICTFFISHYQSSTGRPKLVDRIYGIIFLMTEPFLLPIRKFLRRFQDDGSAFATIDFSPLAALLILQVLHRIILAIIT